MRLSIVSPAAMDLDWDRDPPPAPDSSPSGVYRLPVLIAGRGERRDDCTHYGECLGRFVRSVKYYRGRSHDADAPARCPAGCSSFALVPSHVRHGIAHGNITQAQPERPW